jgi:hypothetical protein
MSKIPASGSWEACGPYIRTSPTVEDEPFMVLAALLPDVLDRLKRAQLMAAAPDLYAACLAVLAARDAGEIHLRHDVEHKILSALRRAECG